MKSKVLYKQSRQLEPPSKDYVSLQLTEEKLTIHRFRIRYLSITKVLKYFKSPANLKMNGSSGVKTEVATVGDFLDGDLQDNVLFYFGKPVLSHLLQLARGEIDHLERLSDSLKVIADSAMLDIGFRSEYYPNYRSKASKVYRWLVGRFKSCVIVTLFGALNFPIHGRKSFNLENSSDSKICSL